MEEIQNNNLETNSGDELLESPVCNANEPAEKTVVCSECGTAFDESLDVCPNCGCPKDVAADEPEAAACCEEEEAAAQETCYLGGAFKVFFAKIVYVLFVLPAKCWKDGAKRLSASEGRCGKLDDVKTEWPLITYARKLFLDYMFDAVILISWLSIAACVYDLLHYGNATVCVWITGVYVCYFMPALITLAKDAVSMILRFPIRRLIHIQKMHAQCIDKKMGDYIK